MEVSRCPPGARPSCGTRLLRACLVALAICSLIADLSAATFSLTPTNLPFGQQTVGVPSAVLPVTLSNRGKAALQFAVSTTGTNPSEFVPTSACGSVVPAGGSCTISVRFTPGAVGNRTATLLVTDTQKPSNKDTVKLSGVGVASATVSPTSLAFGNVATNVTSAARTFTLTNNQTTPLTVSLPTPSNPDYTTTSCALPLAAGASCVIAVSFTPTAPAGTVENATLSIAHSGTNSPITVALSGTSVVPFTLTPASFTFPSTFQGQVSTSAITVRNNQSASTSVTPSTSAPFGVSGCGASIPGDGGTCTLTVQFAPVLSHLGAVSGTLAVSSTAPAVYTVNAALSGTALPPVTVAPTSLNFGGVTVGSTGTPLQVTVTNHQPSVLTFNNPRVSFTGAAADFAEAPGTCGPTLAGGASCEVALTFHPTIGGSRQATLNINSNAFNSPHQVTLAGVGTTPLTISPGSLAFGNVNVGLASASQAITIQNNQSIAAGITSLVFGGDFSQAPSGTTCGATIPALQSCVVAIVATPSVAGPRAGSLVIANNTSEPSNTVTLSATGVNGMTASVLSLTFAPQLVGTTSGSQQIVLTNHQAVPAALGTAVTGDFAASDACAGTVPALSTCAVAVTFTPAAAGARTGSVTFNNPGSPATIVALQGQGAAVGPPAGVLSVVPGAGTIGTAVLGVVVTGNESTNFSAASVVDFGAGITVSNLRNVSAHALTVDVALAAGGVPGARTVTVTTAVPDVGTETAAIAAGFVVSASANLAVASVTPDTGAQGQTLEVQIVGTDTHFLNGTTYATFGDEVVVNAVTVQDPTHATANVSVSPTATLGWRQVQVVTGGEIATITPVGASGPGFQVVAGSAHLLSVTPDTGVQGGVPLAVTITGDATSFLQGASGVSFGTGINVGNIQVADATHLTVTIAVTAGAASGLRTVVVTTGGEVASLADGFTVIAAPPPALADVTPNTGQQGQSLSLTLTGSNTYFTNDQPAPTLTLGSSITVDPLVIVDDTTIAASIAIDALAFAGSRQGVLSSGGTNFPFAFTVTPSGAAIASVAPASGPQGGVVTVTVTGNATHWQQGSTTAVFPIVSACQTVPAVDAVTVDSATQATLTISIPANACVGGQVLRLATGGEVLDSSFGVYAQTPSLTLGPASAMIGSAPTVNLLGEFTHFGASTTAIIDGAGVAIDNFTVTTGATATARFVVAANAPTGLRTVTLTTPIGGVFEVVTAAFSVGDTPAILTSVDPFHAAPGTQALVTIEGQFTHFGATTTVGLGPDIQVSAPTILGPTKLTVLADISAAAATGWRSVFVNTGSEQLTAGFRIDAPGAPSIQSVVPSSAVQGQSLSVQITGTSTSFNQTSTPILGAGVTVSDFTVTSPTTITATIAVSPTAPIGPNTVLVLTDMAAGQIEVATGAGFNVGRGPSNIFSVTPNVVAQSQIVNVSIVAQGTHWLQGGTTADFGPGITVAQLTVQDPTHATAQLTVLSTAALGFHTVTLMTDGEIASLAQGIDVQQGTPVLLSSTPNAGSQGTSFTVTALGSLTHWVQGETLASYGPGVAVTGMTAVDSRSAILNVAIDPLAFPTPAGSCHPLTITTGDEQVSLPSQLCVQAGAAVLTSVSPNAALQGSTLTLQVTGQNTHFTPGLTQASFGDGINTSNVTVTGPTTASVDLAVSTQAASGFRTGTFTTLGETASLALAFNVGQNTPTLNAAAPFAGQRGQSLSVHLVGQYTDWMQGSTTVTFGEGILVGPTTVLSATTLDVEIDIGALATLGGRLVTVTTGGEIVSKPVFNVVAGGASITSVTPQSGNQGQQITLGITGQNTNWQQGFTQFSIAGAGNDITVNFVVVNSPTSATVGLTVAPTAAPGPRSVFMSTGPEALVSAGAFVVTGGVPAIASISPGSARAGDTGLAVQIAGLYTTWLTGTTTVDFGPGIAVSNVVVNNDTSITAVLNVGVAAGLGHRTVAVRNVSVAGTQALTGSFEVVSPQPPAPSLQYLSPAAGLRGQTFTINLSAANTHFDPAAGATEIDFGDPQSAGILINSFQVTSQTTARVNITIAGNAAIGSRVMSIVTYNGTGDEIVQGTFSVVQAVPQLTIVDPGTGMQGATVTVNLVGSYTGFNNATVFDFGPGITVLESQVSGGLVAEVRVAIDDLAAPGARYITATSGAEVVTAQFIVTASTAVIVSVTPNTAKQGESVTVEVVGHDTDWTGATIFNFGAGTLVTDGQVDSLTQRAILTVAVDALAPVGVRAVTAQIGGQLAALINGFVVQPGTALILSSSPASGQQQASVTLTILGQATAWDQTTTADLGPGVAVLTVQPTSTTALTVGAIVHPLALLGPRTLTVTTGAQVLTLGNAFSVTPGSAAIAQLVPAEAGQGSTLNVDITGVNTSFVDGTTQAFFSGGIPVNGVTVNGVTVNGPTSATANISIAAGATPGFRTVALVTEGETAAIVNGFTVAQAVPFIQFVSPSSAAQGAVLDLTVVGSLTNFTAATVFDFGPGVTVNLVTPNGPAATVNVTVSPVAARTTRAVSATTAGATATGANLFTVTAGPAYISAASPSAGVRGQAGLQVTISGVSTHFLAGTPVVDLGEGVTMTQVSVVSDTQLLATVTIDAQAPTLANNVVVTTGGEVATLVAGFTVQQAYVSSVAPTSAYQDQTLDVVVTGVLTHFAAGQTLASFGPDVIVNTVTVQSPTQATVNVKVQLAATPGARTVTMTTGLESASGIALFSVLAKETPIISWGAPADIVYGTALGAAQLNATANTAGTFSYTPDAGTVLGAGQAQLLSVSFTPDNTVRYFSATATVYINVAKAPQPALSLNAPASAQYQESFQVTATGGDGTGLVTFDVTAPCTNAAGGGTVTMTSGTGTCSITATKAGDNNFFPITSPAVIVTASKAPQAALTVTGAPSSAPNGSSFTVGAVGGSAGALTFDATGSCTIAGLDVTMTASIGSCSITTTRAGDANYLPVTSAAVVVTASGPVPPALDVLSSTASLSVPTPPITGSPLPGVVSVRLQANGVNVLAPAGGVTVTASSDNTACVTTSDGTIAGGTYVGTFGIAYATAPRPCSAIITATAVGYGSDVVTVTVYDYASAPVTSSATALSYYNPALLASPAGSLTASVAAVSYYNPALLPTPSGIQASSVSAVSYYNPALLPNPVGGATSSISAVSYYNPALLPTPTGEGATNTASVSYDNPMPTAPLGAESLLAAVALEPVETTVTVQSVSVANGPTAATVRPARLSLSGGLHYVLQIDGANLSEATIVTLAGLEPYVSILPPVASADGRRLTVDVQLAPNTPLGVVPVLVGGSGWTTPDVPGMRVEIAP